MYPFPHKGHLLFVAEYFSLPTSMSSLNMAQEGFSGVGVPDHLSLEEDLLCTRMKFLCSYGGKILPRPSDGKLRYVGGETRIIVVNRDISYEELMSKMMDLYGQIMTLKYQLPDEDLDALVSVSSNEDLENMVDEYNRLETGEICPKLRVFLFSTVEHDMPYTHESGEKNSLEQLYLDAINGITDAASKKQIDSSVVNTTYPLDNLIGFDVVDSWYVSSSLETSVSHHNSYTQSFHVPQHSSKPEFPPAYNPQLLVYLDNPTSSHPILPFQEHFSNTGCQELIESVSDPACNSESAISALMTSNFQPNYGHNSKVWKPSDSFSQFIPDPLPSEICQEPPLQSERGCVNEVRKPTSLIPNSSPQTDVLTSGFKSGTVPISPFTNKLDFIPSENRQEFLTKTEQNFLGEGLPRACNEQAKQLLEPIVQQPFWPDYNDFNLGSQQSIAILQPPVDFHNTVQHQQLSVQQECTGNQQNPLYIIDQYQMPTTIQVEPELHGSESLHPQLVTITDQWQVEEQQRHNELMAITMNCCVPSKSLNASTFSEVISVPPCHGEAPALLNLPGSDSYGRSMGLRHVKTKRSMYRAFPKTQQTDRGSDLPDEQTFLYPSPRTHSFEAFNDRVLQSERKPYLETPILSQGEVTNELKCTYDGSSISYSHGRTHPASPMIPSYSAQKKIYDGISYCPQHQDGVDWANQEAQQVMEVDGNMQYQPQQSIAEIDIRGRFVQTSDVDDRFWQIETQQQNANDQLLKDQYEPDNLQFQTDNTGRASRIEVSHEKPNQVPNFVNRMRALPEGDVKVITSQDMATVSAAALEDTFSKEHKTCADFLGHEHIKPFLLQQNYSAGKPEPRPLDKIFSASDYPLDFNHTMRNGFTPVELPTASRMAIHGAATASSLQHFKEQPYFEDQKSEELQYATSKGIASQSPGHLLQNRLDKLEERFEFQDLSRMPSGGMDGKNLQSPTNLTRDTPEDFHVWDLDAGKININPIQNSLISIDNEMDQAFSTAFKDLVNVQASQPNVFNTRNSGTSSFSVTSICLAQNPADLGCPSVQKDFVALDVLRYDEQSLQNVADETKGLTSLCASELVSTAVDHLEKSAALHSENNRNSAGQLIKNDNLLQEALHANGIMDKVNEMMPDKFVEYDATVNANEEGKLRDEDSSLFLLDGNIVLASSQSKLQSEKHSWGSKRPSDVTVAELSHAQNALELDEGKPTFAKAVVIEERHCSLSTIAKDADFEGGASSAEAEAIARGLQTIKNSDLEELQELGSGTYGTVYHGKWRGSDVAIKRIKSSCFNKKPSERERLIADFWREACTLSQLHHPNVVAFYGVVPDGPDGTLATVTEFMLNGSLKQVLQRKDRTIDRRRRLLIAMDAAFGMEYLHEKKIVHFDLKCENLLVNMRDPHRPVCKVGDLGLSKVKHQTMVSGGVRGTLPWMAPELLNGRSSLVSEKVDIFSFGIVMWELLTCEEPYADLHYGAIIGGIVNNTLRPAIPDWCDPLWRSLMVRCWSNEPGERPSFSQISSELRAMATSQNTKVQGQTQVHI